MTKRSTNWKNKSIRTAWMSCCDLFFQLVDLFVIRDRVCAKIIVALQQTFDRAIKTALGQTGHHQDIVAQRRERFVECPENVFGRSHGSKHQPNRPVM